MAGGTTVTISAIGRDGSKIIAAGSCGTTISSKNGYTYVLKYKVGVGGTYQTLLSQVYPGGSSPDISTSTQWTYTFDCGTLDAIYLQFAVTDNIVPTTYTGTSAAISAVSYDKTKTSRASKSKKNIATSNSTRRAYPNF